MIMIKRQLLGIFVITASLLTCWTSTTLCVKQPNPSPKNSPTGRILRDGQYGAATGGAWCSMAMLSKTMRATEPLFFAGPIPLKIAALTTCIVSGCTWGILGGSLFEGGRYGKNRLVSIASTIHTKTSRLLS